MTTYMRMTRMLILIMVFTMLVHQSQARTNKALATNPQIRVGLGHWGRSFRQQHPHRHNHHQQHRATLASLHDDRQQRDDVEELPSTIHAVLPETDKAFLTQSSYAFRTTSNRPSSTAGKTMSEWEQLETTIPSARLVNKHQPNPQVAAGGAIARPRPRPLIFWENMVCGAISRSFAQTIMHPANTMKTILQSSRGPSRPTIAQLVQPSNFQRLTVGAGANFLLSVPHGAVNFAVLELVRKRLQHFVDATPFLKERQHAIGPGLDFFSSAISTITCSVVSTPQMMITDNIMAGNYPNLAGAIAGLYKNRGIMGFYAGWWPGLVGKIPSYGLTWTLFQGLKDTHHKVTGRMPRDLENSAMGCMASATTVCIMIPIDTIKTRLVTQAGKAVSERAYKGIIDCAVKIVKEEGVGAFYRGLPPRLVSVVPMIGIQFGVYEAMKKVMLQRSATMTPPSKRTAPLQWEEYDREEVFREATMEVAASLDQPYPAPQFLKRVYETSKENVHKQFRKMSPNPKNKK